MREGGAYLRDTTVLANNRNFQLQGKTSCSMSRLFLSAKGVACESRDKLPVPKVSFVRWFYCNPCFL